MRKKFVILVLVILPLVLSGCINNGQSDDNLPLDKSLIDKQSNELFSFSEMEYDFGIIKQSGGIVSHDFNFIYNGSEELKIVAVPTSCVCTSATIDKQVLFPGDKAVISVLFDPNLHVEPEGRFFKTVILLTEPKVTPQLEIKIWVAIDLDLGPETYKLKDEHID